MVKTGGNIVGNSLPAGKPKRRFFICIFDFSNPGPEDTKKPRDYAVLLPKYLLVFLVWRRRRDLNPRAGFPTYSLSRGAPSPLGYFSMVKIYIKNIQFTDGGEEEIRTLGPLRDH